MAEIKVSNVSKSIRSHHILSDVSCNFDPGHIYGLVGSNGSGKTMLLRAISGLIYPTAGKIEINGKDLKRGDFPCSIGVLINDPAFPKEFTGRQNLQHLAAIKKLPDPSAAAENALFKVGLRRNADKRFSGYSLGMKQRLGIAAAILGDPEIILLDEPTNALDTDGIALLKEIIRSLPSRKNTVVIIASHELQIVQELCDTILVMKEGRLSRIDSGEGASK
ncbi:MAG: ABC transporter ATP-binding protein [Subdoligranulum sp.]|nr:ABC transporter ATP-binding protein [Subdoligranulum sp.]